MDIKDLRRKLIVSADDFGTSALTNNNILELVKLGKIDRVSVMINGNLSLIEIEALKNSPAKIDIHSHLITPNSNYWKGDQRLKEGVSRRILFFIFNYLFQKTSSVKVETQWTAQIDKFREIFGKNPDGLGSHEHIHFFPPYFKIALKLSKKYGISYIRFGKNPIHCENLISKILDCLRKANFRLFNQSKLETSNFLIGLNWIKNYDPDEFWKKIKKDGQTEIVCHPEREEEFEFIRKYF